MSKALAQLAFSHNLVTEQIIHLGTMCRTAPMADVAMEAFQENWDEIIKACGLTYPAPEIDDESLAWALQDANLHGFLVQIGTPVPATFAPDGSYLFFNGHLNIKWFYADTLEAVFEAAAKWQERYVEEKRINELSKEATAC